MELHSIKEADIKDRSRVLVRMDFDVPLLNGGIADDSRIRASLDTLNYIMDRGASVRIVAHLGRPGGVMRPELTMRPVVDELSRILGEEVIFVADPGDEALYQLYNGTSGVLFFENIRFWKEEEENSSVFAGVLARWADVYVGEAFANSHRRHASMVAIADALTPYAGFHFIKEIAALNHVMDHPARPFVVILGGAKIGTKFPLIRRFLGEADHVIVAGALANSLYYLKGFEIGKSYIEEIVKTFVWSDIFASKKLYLPSDVAVSAEKDADDPQYRICPPDRVLDNECIVDIGSHSTGEICDILASAKTVVWNGPLGYAERPQFAKGTQAVLAQLSSIDAYTLAGGGDTIAAIRSYGRLSDLNHVSMGGGAMIEFLSGAELPGVEALIY